MEEEQDFSDNYQNEEDEENFNKLDVITEENNYNSENNNYSTNKKGEKDKIKSSSSSKYSNEIQTFKQQNEIIGTENIKEISKKMNILIGKNWLIRKIIYIINFLNKINFMKIQ